MSFKKDFKWGTGTAAYQIEGAFDKDGKGISVWDTFVHENIEATIKVNNGGGYDSSGRILNGDTGDIACDHYNRYKEDVQILKELGVNSYRFSIAWTRILPNGIGEINEKGLKFYSDLVDELLANGIEPFVTLFHWDYPQTLQDRNGWLNEKSPEWFEEYVKVIVGRLSNRVKNWMTFNEPQCVVNLGHDNCEHAPGIKYTEKERLLMTHNILLAHGRAVKVIRENSETKCNVGIALNAVVMLPADNSEESVELVRQANFTFNGAAGLWNNAWWFDSILLGEYPKEGLEYYKDIMPEIKAGDLELISQPLDFLGVNLYQGMEIMYDPVTIFKIKENKPGYATTSLEWKISPEVLYYMPKYLQERYHMPIYITENGMANLDWIHLDGKVHDPQRIDFLHRYLSQLKRAVDEGIDIRGYFCWSLMDNFEWAKGYSSRFGLVYVDYTTQERIIKDSGYWYKHVIETQGNEL